MWVDSERDIVMLRNYTQMLPLIKARLQLWTNRSLSLYGKVCVVNTLIASLLIHKMTVLETIPENIIKAIEAQISGFIWNHRRPKISMSALQKSKPYGGIKLVNLKWREIAIKCKWIKILANDYSIAELAYRKLSPILKEDIWRCNLSAQDVMLLFPRAGFWKDVRAAWAVFTYKPQWQEKDDITENQLIWLNTNLRIQNKPFLWKECYHRGLRYVSQLVNAGTFIPYVYAHAIYGVSMMQYNSLSSLFKSVDKVTLEAPCSMQMYDKMLKRDDISRVVYAYLADGIDARMIKLKNRWEHELQIEISMEKLLSCFHDIHTVTNIPKYRSFQFRLLHRALVLNPQLARWGMCETGLCTFCQKEVETLSHLFVHCERLQDIWIPMESFMNKYSAEQIDFNVESVLTNRFVKDRTNIKIFLCLITKQYIYRNRCLKKNLIFAEIKASIKQIECMEKYNAVQKNNLQKHLKKWYGTTKDSSEDDAASYLYD